LREVSAGCILASLLADSILHFVRIFTHVHRPAIVHFCRIIATRVFRHRALALLVDKGAGGLVLVVYYINKLEGGWVVE
jgi:hypothetical protein